MTITLLGYVSILLTVFFLVKRKPEYFLYSSIFFCGWTGASIVNLGDLPIQPSFYFFIIYFLLSFRFTVKKVGIPILLSVFMIYCGITLIFPLLLQNNNIEIMKQNGEYGYLKFSISNISQYAYLILDFLFLRVLLKNKNNETINNNIIKWYKFGFYSVIAICIYQILAFELDLPFDVLFRQSPHGNVQGNRIYGPTIEASMLCYYLVPSIFFMILLKPTKYEWIAVVLGMLLGLYSFSSTFLMGIIFMLIACIVLAFVNNTKFTFLSKKRRTVSLVAIGAGAIAAVAVVFLGFGYMLDFAENLLDKLNGKNISGSERIETFETMSNIGLHYPTGVGFGSSRSKDLLSTWLCNIGVLGLALFIAFVISYIVRGYKYKRLAMTIPFVIIVLLMLISVPEPYNFFVWFFVYIGLVPNKKEIKEDTEEEKEMVIE